MRRAEREALALGLLHGPVELLPVSSSGHATALPVAAGLGGRGLGRDAAQGARGRPARRHRGRAADRRARPARAAAGGCSPRRSLPPALAGLALERPIEARLGTPATLAAGLLAGAAALVARRPGARRARRADATTADGLVARARAGGRARPGRVALAGRRSPPPARAGSRAPTRRGCRGRSALPVLLGASGLKAWRLARRARRDGPSPASRSAPARRSRRRWRPRGAIGLERRAAAVAVGGVAGGAGRGRPRRAPESPRR